MQTPELNTIQHDDPALLAERFIQHSGTHVFLTGKAGTGKTTFLRHIAATTHKRYLIAAPTGIAALNAGGVTLHSQFQLPIGGYLPIQGEAQVYGALKFETAHSLVRHFRMSKLKMQVIRQTQLLIIDEVSMLRADMLDALDRILRFIRRNPVPFGGVQLLLIGDLLQLPPVVKDDEWQIMKHYYNSPYFFDAHALKQHPPVQITLQKVYRQQDEKFTDLLNRLRYNQLKPEDVNLLNSYHIPGFTPGGSSPVIQLTTHNYSADQINQSELRKLEKSSRFYQAKIEDEFPENLYPTEVRLELKVGAQVMFIKNDLSTPPRYFNGKLGKIVSLSDEVIYIDCEGETIPATWYTWENKRFQVDEKSGEVKEDIIGTFRQFPLRLAWAITIHKSQGLTFDRAIIDVQQVFASGQAYVALSRLRTLQGLVLSAPFPANALEVHPAVKAFEESGADSHALPMKLQRSMQAYFFESLKEAFDFRTLVKAMDFFMLDFSAAGTKSVKASDTSWLGALYGPRDILRDVGPKFLRQIDQIMTQTPFNWEHLEDRLTAAGSYFSPQLEVLGNTLWVKFRQLSEIKRAKSYANDVEQLETLVCNAWVAVQKIPMLLKAYRAGHFSDDQDWKESLEIQWRNQPIPEAGKTLKKEIAKAKAKGQTYLETYELYKQGLSTAEIAAKRNLAASTIESHYSILISSGKIKAEELIAPERISAIRAFIATQDSGLSLTELRAVCKNEFSFFELRVGGMLEG
jgi:energy-coupling factor transporter ATP-binding protein EcfA2